MGDWAEDQAPLKPTKRPWTIAQQLTDYFPLMAIASRDPSSRCTRKGVLPIGSFGVGFRAHLGCDS
jgi:hypothetical protein